MSATAKAEGYGIPSYVPQAWERSKAVRIHPVTTETHSSSSQGTLAQRCLPLLRVMRPAPTPKLAPHARCDSPHTDSDFQPAPATEHSIGIATQQNAFVGAKPAPLSFSHRQLWSAASVGLLRAEYPTSRFVHEISAELGRSVGAVYGKARRLNLKRPRRGATLAEGAAPLLVPAAIPDVPQPVVAPPPEPPPPTPPAAPPTLSTAKPPPFVLEPTPARTVERTKMGGRPGCWTENDGALSERLERLFISNFSPACIAAVLDVTVCSVGSRAWVVNCPRRDPRALRHDVEAARLIDRLAAPLPPSVYSWKQEKTLFRKRCTRKGHYIWGTNGTTLSNDARRQRSYKHLMASAPMHAW